MDERASLTDAAKTAPVYVAWFSIATLAVIGLVVLIQEFLQVRAVLDAVSKSIGG